MNVTRMAAPCMKLSKSLVVPHSGVMARFASVTKGQVHPGYEKIKEKYKHFQIEDGVPIHLKGGAFDRFLYYTTLAGCGVGLVMCFEYYYSAAFPKKC
ncbi:putative cytochrome c oxidase subunit 7A, mitochondrial [Orchesella cincta]|uniref:Putative cytochrome c oxidase subunit 7A, mitochondrial n=1 Tax=Orchesella cincta TaxID=48709 RepID=A0A1D2MLR3_ORCCI|nr:putative cytochrome c oxidase subunit 7A, mitochondrial [Orchesella cincta]